MGIGAYAGRMDDAFREWRDSIRELASCPNVTIKLGGLGMPLTGFDFHERRETVRSSELAEAWRPYIETTRSEEHPSALQSLMRISYAVFCLYTKTYISFIFKHYT